MKQQTIGVIGGIGAAASANFYQELIHLCQKQYNAHNDEDFPHIIINSMSSIGLDYLGKGQEVTIQGELLKGINSLYLCGADFGVIVCNTVHKYFDYLIENSKLPLVSIIDVTVKEVVANHQSCVGILSSKDTKDEGLYEKALSASSINVIASSESEQIQLDEIISHVISGKVSQSDGRTLASIMKSMAEKGAEGIVLGCTELPLAFNPVLLDVQLAVHNTIVILAQEAIKRSKGIL